MTESLKDKLFSSRFGQFGILIFSAYTLFWAFVEPLGIKWIDENLIIWRFILICGSFLIAVILTIRLTKSVLEKVSAEGVNTLQSSYSSGGNPVLKPMQDGVIGAVLNIKGNYSNDPLDWIIKSSAQRANELEVIFTHNGMFCFYLRVGMLSQDGQTSIEKWIRFDSNLTTPDKYSPDTPELGVPFDSKQIGSFDKALIRISDAVRKSYGQGGWTYNKIFMFRIRCVDATIKSFILKK